MLTCHLEDPLQDILAVMMVGFWSTYGGIPRDRKLLFSFCSHLLSIFNGSPINNCLFPLLGKF